MKSVKVIKHDHFQLWAWLLFVASALFFITSSIHSGDMIGLMGGLLFLLACVAFLIPLISAMRTTPNSGLEQQAADTE